MEKIADQTELYYCDQSCDKIYNPPQVSHVATIPDTQNLISGTWGYYFTALTALKDVHVTYMRQPSGGSYSYFSGDYYAGDTLPDVSGNYSAKWTMLIWPR